MPIQVDKDELIDYARRIFQAIGTPSEQAELLARRLVRAHLRGHPSHGVARIKQYMDAYRAGMLDPKAEPTVEVEGPCYANVNGNRSFGQVAGTFAMELAIKKAKISGLCIVGCHNMNHVGCLGDYQDIYVKCTVLLLVLEAEPLHFIE